MCTNFKIRTETKKPNELPGVVIGRSMEFAIFMGAKLYFSYGNGKTAHQNYYDPFIKGDVSSDISKDYKFTWKKKYSFVSMNAFNQPIVTDGINTEGLWFGTLQLNSTIYQEITDPKKGLSFTNFGHWILSSFKNCEEVRKSLEAGTVQVNNFWQEAFGQHFSINDKHGESIVIEIIDGEMKVWDNTTYGVLTNDPILPWQIENLKNYVSVTPVNTMKSMKGNLKQVESYQSYGTGFIPVSSSQLPSARFVKAAYSVNYAYPVHDTHEATNLAFHILNTVDIPIGIVRKEPETIDNNSDHTLWISVSNLTDVIYNVRMYESPLSYSIKLDELDFEKLDGKQYAIPIKNNAIDLTNRIDQESEITNLEMELN
ncbi:linear amide C-N hydrolase [Aquimarina sp. 2201CG5-10]|uniref:linear amide C-N hydrolase n=1 Tax=Aquimarina callyspongiae TaxID=3098150 RepID=UPI002AB3A0EE|nr:linear amide C-N hydrolase [Aquimarina sp. 2201CG5-10]MDY8138606.1 linear amide C-N hydrolase [Aquimarina sp. 2201CG5-10]